ncbi:MAG: trigger factor [Lachnospiraceae bacterium]|nr:trigger factor [Lachnospiraceae bacterium]
MKKKFALLLTMLLLAFSLTACGEKGKDNENINVTEMKVEKYVTLGEYKGLAVTAPKVAVNPAEKEQLMRQVFNQYITKEKDGILEGTVKNGDYVNIDYEGKKDGVAFAGGTAAGQSLGIGTNQFIPGFESGLIGVNVGETVDLNLTFPENYGNAELAGQAVVFTVTVNFIYPEFKDEIIASWGEDVYKTVDELDAYIENYLLSMAQSNYDYVVENAVVTQFIQNCVFAEKLPQEMIDNYRVRLMESVEAEATMYGMDAESYCQYVNGMVLADFLDMYAEVSAKQVIALQTLANKEGLMRTEEELDAAISEAATANGYTNVQEFLGENTREDYREYYMFEDTIAFLVENAVITVQ